MCDRRTCKSGTFLISSQKLRALFALLTIDVAVLLALLPLVAVGLASMLVDCCANAGKRKLNLRFGLCAFDESDTKSVMDLSMERISFIDFCFCFFYLIGFLLYSMCSYLAPHSLPKLIA